MKLKILVNSKAQAPFWVRLFRLEQEMEEVRKQVAVPGRRVLASAPVINEYRVDENLQFAYCLLFQVDAVGVVDCLGIVFIFDEPNRAEIIKARDDLADEVMEEMTKRHQEKVARGEGEFVDQIRVIEPGSEETGQMLDEILKQQREKR